MSDAGIVERLREANIERNPSALALEAADEIERQQKEIAKLRSMLRAVSNEYDIAAQLARLADHDPDDLISIRKEGEPAPPLARAWSWFVEDARALLSGDSSAIKDKT